MQYHPYPLYSKSFSDLQKLLAMRIDKGCSLAPPSKPVELFFRADDIGVPSKFFTQLVSLFQKHRLPLCLAVVPAWLTKARYTDLLKITEHTDELWCWHQHGRLHKNFEMQGKKQEFGPARDYHTIHHHLKIGRDRLSSLMGASLQPFFTPPWNRCNTDTVNALKELNFAGISRSKGARPDYSDILPDFQVNVDLHTRRESDPDVSLTNLLDELENALASGRCGIMIHHQRMNNNAFVLLDLLMEQLSHHPEISPKLFQDLL